MIAAQTTRRGILGGLAAALSPARVAPAGATAVRPNRSQWEAALARLAAAEKAADIAGAEADRADEAYEAVRPKVDAVDFHAFPYIERHYVARVLDLDKAWAAWLAGEGRTWWAKDREATIARQKASFDSVLAFRRQERNLDDALGYSAAHELYETAADRRDEAQAMAITMPAPDNAALLWKLDRLFGPDGGREDDDCGSAWCAEWLNAVMADAQRLLA